MKDLLKKFWFVAVVALALTVFIVAYGVNSFKNRDITVNTFKNGDEYVVVSVDGDKYYSADDLYDALYDQFGLMYSWSAYEKAVCDKAIDVTSDISTYATNYASYLMANNDTASIDAFLRSNGYVNGSDDLYTYCVDQLKKSELLRQYFTENFDVYGGKVMEENKPRDIYHILIKVADISTEKDEDGNFVNVANPTDEEAAKLNAVLEALKTQSFEDVAAQFSEDSSAAEGGHIGIIHTGNASNYDTTFANTSLALNNEEVSDVIVSQYGYHIIYAKEATKEIMTESLTFMEDLASMYPYGSIKAVFDKGTELGFEIVSEDLAAEIATIIEAAESEVTE